MDDDHKDDLSLRDKIALEILNGVLSNELIKGSGHFFDIVKFIMDEDKDLREAAKQRLECLIRSCYKTADIVRKVRLTVFD